MLFGGWNCTAVSSSSQNCSLTHCISTHPGRRSLSMTWMLTCSHPIPSLAIIASRVFHGVVAVKYPLQPALLEVANCPSVKRNFSISGVGELLMLLLKRWERRIDATISDYRFVPVCFCSGVSGDYHRLSFHSYDQSCPDGLADRADDFVMLVARLVAVICFEWSAHPGLHLEPDRVCVQGMLLLDRVLAQWNLVEHDRGEQRRQSDQHDSDYCPAAPRIVGVDIISHLFFSIPTHLIF